ncbi:subtilisin family serine protease [Deinococcus metalli]|uniref:Serine protease n=1 Tax=Deinococcus metalli TaxID=1141878 RepID=A0A7W8NQA9_9DEIO|nr:S8 family serine peptidase [Deinococcus metalli]MBB5377691.1 subtilisin family serine protease [Deinococcus metalli]GHF52588.1 serine protease [Deinococcus metalli]
MPRKLVPALATVVSTLTLVVGCAQTATTTPPATFPYTSVVPVGSADTPTAVEQRYGGQVVVWRPEAAFAVLGLSHHAAGVLSAQSDAGGSIAVEPNVQAYGASGTLSAWSGQATRVDAGGRAVIWSGGRAVIWSGGRAVIWSGGTGTVGGVPENSASWAQIGLPAAWAAAPNLGQGVKVAVIDTGVDLTHEMFQGALAGPADQWDFVNGDPVPQDEGGFSDPGFGHGTSVAGIVLQIAPHATVMPIRALRPDGSGDETAIAQAINFAVSHGAQVINLSLGSTQKSDVIARMIKFATEQGVSVVSSSGNSGDDKITAPARDADGKKTLGVGSVDRDDRKSSFSTYGDKLDVMAPGETVWGPVPGNYFSYWSGTSMAAPEVTGAVALALGQPLRVAPKDLLATLVDTATDIRPLNKAYGSKVRRRLDVAGFLQAATLP